MYCSVAVSCSVLQCIAVCSRKFCVERGISSLYCVAASCSELQRVDASICIGKKKIATIYRAVFRIDKVLGGRNRAIFKDIELFLQVP